MLTCVVACGTSSTGPGGSQLPPTIDKPKPQVATAPLDAAPALVAPPVAPPKLACPAPTAAKAAPYPEPTWFCAREDGTRDGPFITLFPDQTIQITGSYKDGKLDGPWQRAYHGGAPAEQGQYAAGQKDGHWKQLGPTGSVLGEYDLANGTGTEKRWYDEGTIFMDRQLASGTPHGLTRMYAPDGTILLSAKYYKGKLDGPRTAGTRNTFRIEETFSGGTRTGKRTIWQFWGLVYEENFDYHGRLDGHWTQWRDKKVARFTGDYEHGKRVGPWVWNDRNNNKEREGSYVKGKRDGVWNEWWENKLVFTGTYTEGKPDGTFIYSDRNGNELGRFDIKDGTGTMLTYYGNRKVQTKERIVRGEKEGASVELNLKGKPVVETHWSSGIRWGAWKEWTWDGVPLLEENYRRNRLDGKVRKLVDGKPSLEATYKDGKAEGPYVELRGGKVAVSGQFAGDLKQGTWTYYDASGSVVLTSTYKDGVLDGPWKQLVESGGATLEGTMTAGRRTGTWTRTDKAGHTDSVTYKSP